MARVESKSPPSTHRDQVSVAEYAVELRNVNREFVQASGEHIRGMDEVTFGIPRGQVVCILGPSGQGKSTLINMVAGFDRPDSGEVLVGGAPVTGPGADRGVVFQRDTLFLWKRVADNIEFGLKARGVPKAERKATVQRYLEFIGLEKFARSWPKELSGGMRRRVAIAAVFANDPEVLLMDEPFVGLDYVRRAALHEVLLDLWSRTEKTVLFVTHDVDEALALGDRVLVVQNGRIVRDVPLEFPRPRKLEVLESPEAAHARVEILRSMGVPDVA